MFTVLIYVIIFNISEVMVVMTNFPDSHCSQGFSIALKSDLGAN